MKFFEVLGTFLGITPHFPREHFYPEYSSKISAEQ
jgi:hypothetical protein